MGIACPRQALFGTKLQLIFNLLILFRFYIHEFTPRVDFDNKHTHNLSIEGNTFDESHVQPVLNLEKSQR